MEQHIHEPENIEDGQHPQKLGRGKEASSPSASGEGGPAPPVPQACSFQNPESMHACFKAPGLCPGCCSTWLSLLMRTYLTLNMLIMQTHCFSLWTLNGVVHSGTEHSAGKWLVFSTDFLEVKSFICPEPSPPHI